MKKLGSLLIVLMLMVFTNALRTHAANLLTSGDFEPAGGSEVPEWTLQEFVTGSMDPIDAAQLATSGTTQTGLPGEHHLFNRSFAGGETAGPDNLTNSILSQVQPITAGQEYTFSGWSKFEANYSGGVTTLSGGPLSGQSSPTTNSLVLEFLDAGNSVVGSPLSIDVKADRIAQIGFPDPNDEGYYQHVVTGTAPVGATQARVTADALDMVFNGTGPKQANFYDTFSLTDTSAPATELLLNPGLEDPIPSPLDNFMQVTNDPENPMNEEIFRTASFANRPGSGGGTGLWISSFYGGYPDLTSDPPTPDNAPVDGTIFQTVAGSEGEEYTFSSWSRWEPFFSGGQDILAGGIQPWMGQASPTQMSVELAFLDSGGAVIGTPETLDLKTAREAACGGDANGQTCGPAGDGWVQSLLTATAPAGTVDVRVSGIMVDGVSTGQQQSAFWDDFDLMVASAGTPGDFDGDGDVDGHDFLAWQRGDSPNGVLGVSVSAADLAEWQGAYAPLVAAVGQVPEPATSTSIMFALAALGILRPRK